MKNFAQLVNDKVANIIIADDLFAQEGFIEYKKENPAFVNGDYFNGLFYPKQPYLSWTRDGEGNWIAPIPKPSTEDLYIWNEESIEWIKL